MKVKGLEVLRCDAGWRNYHFLKLTTDEGIVGWSEFDEGFCSPGVSAVIERLAGRVAGQPVFDRERIYTELYCFTRPAAGGVVAEGLGAIENALLDAKAKALGVPCHALLGGKLRDRIRVYWSHCATWRINHPTLYKPAITSLDGVKAIGAEVREKGFGALKTNIFIYNGGAPRAWRPGFGVPFMPELNIAPHNFYGHLATMMNAHFAAATPNLRSWKSTSIACLGTRRCSPRRRKSRTDTWSCPTSRGGAQSPTEDGIRAHEPRAGAGCSIIVNHKRDRNTRLGRQRRGSARGLDRPCGLFRQAHQTAQRVTAAR
jgi:L-alanine-DL-glutamate epimerase-like enolase superfamily enzyme